MTYETAPGWYPRAPATTCKVEFMVSGGNWLPFRHESVAGGRIRVFSDKTKAEVFITQRLVDIGTKRDSYRVVPL